MAIDISKAAEGSFYPFKESINLTAELLSGRLARFVSPLTVQGTYVVDKTNVYLDGFLTVDIEYKCDKCLKDFVNNLKTKFQASFCLAGGEYENIYSNYSIDLNKAVGQEVLLELPTKVLCNTNCKGLCPKCGVNLNDSGCNCDCEETANADKNNPFSVLKNLNNFSGGASNGSTKA